jgi:hypothetical protein
MSWQLVIASQLQLVKGGHCSSQEKACFASLRL